MFVFWKICRALLCGYVRFEIRPFAFLPTICLYGNTSNAVTSK